MNGTDGTQGAVYYMHCVTNPTMQELVKIGMIEKGDIDTLQLRVKKRISDLFSTSTPVPFQLYYAVAVDDPKTIERRLHIAFESMRINSNREFFRIAPEQVAEAMKLTGGEEIKLDDTPSDDAEITVADIKAGAREQARENRRLSNFMFSMVNIPPGETITYIKDPSITATVYDDRNKVLFEGEVMSTSRAAGIVLERRGFARDSGAPSCWEYDGETLHDRRLHMTEEYDES